MNTSLFSIFIIFLKLGCTAFGGPTAHLGFFQQILVEQKKWCTSEEYAQIVALCHILPGPSSSQVGMALGYLQAGRWGAIVAWFGFTLPAATLMTLFGLGSVVYAQSISLDFLKGLQLAAIAVVCQAVWTMGAKLCADRHRFTVMVVATCITLTIPSFLTQLAIICLGALFGIYFLSAPYAPATVTPKTMSIQHCVAWLVFFLAGLLGLPLLYAYFPSSILQVLDIFYRAGSLVFGGGHLVLPLLQNDLVVTEMTQQTTFLAGYGLAQAIPGPMFSLAGFLGVNFSGAEYPIVFAVLSVVAIFLPSFFLVFASLPLWQYILQYPLVQKASLGMQSAVVGLLLATLYHPLWTETVTTIPDVVTILLAFTALHWWKMAPWMVVLLVGICYSYLTYF